MLKSQDLPELTRTKAELQQTVRKLSRLLEISVTLNSTLDREQLLKFILETATDVLNCEAASIMLYDERLRQLNFAAATGSDPKKLAEIPVPLEGSIAGTIFRSNQFLIVNDVEQDPRHFRQVGEHVRFQPRTLVGVPMRIQKKTTGVLEALNKRGGGFTETDAQILFVIASQAAVAIHNAQLLQSLQNAYDELSQLEELKRNFMAITSHELRTPLGLVLGYSTFIKDTAQGELAKHADTVMNAALRLQSLVEDITNMNLLKVGTTELALEKCPLQRVVTIAYKATKSTAEAKNQRLTLNLPKTAFFVEADPEKLELVFINMISNAIRYTPRQGEINVRAFRNRDEVWVEVRDNGYGIPPSELEKIFSEFYQAEDHMTRRGSGLGLGLAIARGLIELHGGRIWAESPGKGKGSTFVAALPEA